MVPFLPCNKLQMLIGLITILPGMEQYTENLANNLFLTLVEGKGISNNPGDYVSLSLQGMKKLEDNAKPNLLYNFSQYLGKIREGLQSPLLPIDRMPYGLVEYTIQFYSCTDTSQTNHSMNFKPIFSDGTIQNSSDEKLKINVLHALKTAF